MLLVITEQPKCVSVALEPATDFGVEERHDLGIIVHDRIYVIDAVPLAVGHVSFVFVSREKPPAAILFVVRQLAIHVADRLAIDDNPIR